VAGFQDSKIVSLLLNISQFEFLLNNMFGRLLKAKPTNWEEYKSEACGRMVELGIYFPAFPKTFLNPYLFIYLFIYLY